MKQKINSRHAKIWIFVLIVAALLFAKVFLNTQRDKLQNIENTNLILTDTPKDHAFIESYSWFGTVESKGKISVVAMKMGIINFINSKEGSPVKKGDLLFTLDDPLIRSNIIATQNEINDLESQITLTENQEEEDRASNDLKLAKEREQLLEKSLQIKATTEGIFTNRKVSAGQLVQKGDALGEIIATKDLYIKATLFQPRNIDLINKKVTIHLADDSLISGMVTHVLPQRTAEGATVALIESPNTNNVLFPGDTVRGIIQLSQHEKALSIQQSAIVKDEQEQSYVFLKDPSGYHKQPVQTGLVSENLVEITSGLKGTDTVVVQGAYELFYQNFNKIYKVAD